jgi:hypothetical protein
LKVTFLGSSGRERARTCLRQRWEEEAGAVALELSGKEGEIKETKGDLPSKSLFLIVF